MNILKELKSIGADISVLYVEDDTLLRESVASYLTKIFHIVDVAKDGAEGLQAFLKRDYDLVVTDIQMPNMNGLEMINAIRKSNPNQEVILTTAFSEVAYFMEAISLNVSAYIIKPFDFDKLNTALFKVSKHLCLSRENENYKKNLETMVQERTAQNLLLEEEKIDNYEKTLFSLVELVEKRDTYTGGHSMRVATYSKLIAQEMGYDDAVCELLYRAGILHDIGKIETPDAVLLKPGTLDALEFGLIKEHVSTGAAMLGQIPMYKELSKIIAAHHERYDGKGYPLGLLGDEIPELSRIMIVADAFDAMTTNRIYKPRMSQENALDELQKFSGTQFDARVVAPALAALKNVKIDADVHQLPSTQMENKRFAYFFEDPTTKAYNQTYLELVLIQNEMTLKQQYMNVVFLHNFTAYNNTNGWDAGNLFLKNIVAKLIESSPEASIFRLHGDDFVMLCKTPINIEENTLNALVEESGNIITISQKKFNTLQHAIHSTHDLEQRLN
jgi:putative nucleotidyltransferase with HDIG domain